MPLNRQIAYYPAGTAVVNRHWRENIVRGLRNAGARWARRQLQQQVQRAAPRINRAVTERIRQGIARFTRQNQNRDIQHREEPMRESIQRDVATNNETYEAPLQLLGGDSGTILTQYKKKRMSYKKKKRIAKKKAFSTKVKRIVQLTVSPKFDYVDGTDSEAYIPANAKKQFWGHLGFANSDMWAKVKTRLNAIKNVQGEETAKYERYGMYIDSVRYTCNIFMTASPITANVPMELTIYHMECKKNVNIEDFADMTALINANPAGDLSVQAADTELTASYADNGYQTVFKHRPLMEYFKVSRTERYYFTTGKAIQINGVVYPGKGKNSKRVGAWHPPMSSDFQQDIWAYSGKTHYIIFAVRSIDGVAGNGTLGGIRNCWSTWTKFHGDTYKQNNFTGFLN